MQKVHGDQPVQIARAKEEAGDNSGEMADKAGIGHEDRQHDQIRHCIPLTRNTKETEDATMGYTILLQVEIR